MPAKSILKSLLLLAICLIGVQLNASESRLNTSSHSTQKTQPLSDNTEEALSKLQQLLADNPENPEVLLNMATLYAKTGQWSAFESIIKPIEGISQIQDLVNYLRGRLALTRGRAGTARAYFEKALQQLPSREDPLRALIHFHHAICLEKLNRRQSAEEELIQALDFGYQPESEKEAIDAARILLRMGEPNRTIPILQSVALHQSNAKAEIWALLGRAHQAADQSARAVSAYSQSLIVDPEQPDILALRAGLHRSLGQFKSAQQDYCQAIKQSPDNPQFHYAYSLLLIRLGKIDKAYSSLTKASDSTENLSVNPLLLALLAHSCADLSSARNYISQVIKTQSGDRCNESAYYLDYILTCAAGQYDQALHLLQKRAEAPEASAAIGIFLAYCTGLKTRKEVLDLAGRADTPNQAKRRIAEAAYWMAQHEKQAENSLLSRELLEIVLQSGYPDLFEYQFAAWQLGKLED